MTERSLQRALQTSWQAHPHIQTYQISSLIITLLMTSHSFHSNRDGVSKATEAHIITRGKTLQPLGLNERDEM